MLWENQMCVPPTHWCFLPCYGIQNHWIVHRRLIANCYEFLHFVNCKCSVRTTSNHSQFGCKRMTERGCGANIFQWVLHPSCSHFTSCIDIFLRCATHSDFSPSTVTKLPTYWKIVHVKCCGTYCRRSNPHLYSWVILHILIWRKFEQHCCLWLTESANHVINCELIYSSRKVSARKVLGVLCSRPWCSARWRAWNLHLRLSLTLCL